LADVAASRLPHSDLRQKLGHDLIPCDNTILLEEQKNLISLAGCHVIIWYNALQYVYVVFFSSSCIAIVLFCINYVPFCGE